ncbi:Crp/Fnr family transcriptional regulator [Sphingobacterium endophyticum]|uniref:Crp/Fnr family transcriptional regulator n=1 Tax=Sphingobacterium endophyticum TaxID=2546448 RepID=UPI001E44B2C5|nr:Crp/Fnr family transcriptional regulator [Sphingobacterium endophyticum]
MYLNALIHIFNQKIIVKRNDFLKQHDTIDTRIYLIKTGSLKISIYQEDEEQIVRFGYAGDLIVALDSFINDKRSDFMIQAIKKSEVWFADKRDFFNFIYSSKVNTELYIRILEDLVLQQIEREKDLLLISPKERYQRVLHRNPKLFQIIPHKYIANYLRMTPETLSRLKKY